MIHIFENQPYIFKSKIHYGLFDPDDFKNEYDKVLHVNLHTIVTEGLGYLDYSI